MHMHGVDLEFTRGALRAVARAALRRGTGARGLRTLLERLLTEVRDAPPPPPTRSSRSSDSFVILRDLAMFCNRQ